MRTLLSICALALLMPQVAQARLLELTFDDAKAGTGVATGDATLANMEGSRAALGVDPALAQLVGTAVRSAITAGRYGRAAEFPDGAGYVEIKTIPAAGQTPTAFFWVKGKDLSKGTLLETTGLFKLVLDKGSLFLDVAQATGPDKRISLGATFPTDGAWHHVTLAIDQRGATPKVALTIDLTKAGEVTTALVKPTTTPDIRLGEGFTGWIDEVLISGSPPGANDLFDRSPTNCPAGLTCVEEVITMTPTGFTHEIPVRFKAAYDPSKCSASSPCQLLFDVSGGNDCADDYAGTGSVAHFANAGFLVVTGDAYCEASSATNPYPTETSQYIAVKDHLLTKSAVKSLIKGTSYHASGCSHGAGMVVVWMLHEKDHPLRTYARSPGLDPVCVFANKIVCPAVFAEQEKRVKEALGGPIDWENKVVQQMHDRSASPVHITTEVAKSRDLVISWGINLTGPVCNPDGSFACNEQGQWGMNWGARRFRDVWKAREPAGKPTGYFVEDHGKDCRHCASTNSQAFSCGLCLLQHGRAGMKAQCPKCLDYSAPDIEAGKAGERCDIKASWYTDPLAPTSGGDGSTDGSSTDAGAVDGGGAEPPTDDGGCCSTAPGGGASPGALLLLAFVFLRIRRSSAGR